VANRIAAYEPMSRRAAQPLFEVFLACAPGLEDMMCEEARTKGFAHAVVTPGGVAVRGGWSDVWRANLWLRGATKVIARIAAFEADHLTTLEARARRVAWASVLRRDVPVRVEAVCRRSRIFHSGAAAERIAVAIGNTLGAPIADDAPVAVMARIEDNQVTLGVDTSGDLLHKRGFKTAVTRAPLRETLAALLLRQCGFDGQETVFDPMCGSGTFLIEAAEIAAGLNPGRARSFAFEHLATFDASAWAMMRQVSAKPKSDAIMVGQDRDAQAVSASEANAARAGVASRIRFAKGVISDAQPPPGPPGLVIVNPPYGSRLGDTEALAALYASFGRVMRERFSGWRIGLVTSESSLAWATGLPFLPPSAPVANGGIRITLYRTERL
jgi:putative N6-adenine-specific DNA methylase